MTKNATNTILMVRPIRFGMNAQTAVDNFYQQQDAATDAALDNAKAQAEFDAFVTKLVDQFSHLLKVSFVIDSFGSFNTFPSDS